MKIREIKGYEVMDSRGNPTVAASVILENGASGFAISPSGASTGMFEAYELRDGDKTRYRGLGVRKVVENINGEINKILSGIDAESQRLIDKILIEADGTENKSRLGANALLAVSLAVAKSAANGLSIPLYRYLGGIQAKRLPRPMMNILNGGAHAVNNIDIQEFMIMPISTESFSESLRVCSEIYHTLGKILRDTGKQSGVGDEGGFAPSLDFDREALDLICEAIDKCGYTGDVKICLDIASSEWYKDGKYLMPKRKTTFDSEGLIEYYETLSKSYPIISIEDGCAEEDFAGWKMLTEKLGGKIQLVGDDLFVTNTKRLKLGIENNIANAVLVKPNQIGTLTETIDLIEKSQKNGYKTVISHRSGESEDTTIADLAVAVNAGQIKTGAPCRSDRVSKYNRLIVIENELI